MDDVASMAVAALEHPEASVTATGSKTPEAPAERRKLRELIRQMRITVDELP
jgi:hypothetical protein